MGLDRCHPYFIVTTVDGSLYDHAGLYNAGRFLLIFFDNIMKEKFSSCLRDFISDSQHRFMPKRSTTTNISVYKEYIINV